MQRNPQLKYIRFKLLKTKDKDKIFEVQRRKKKDVTKRSTTTNDEYNFSS